MLKSTVKSFVVLLLLLIVAMPVQSKETIRQKHHLEFEATALAPVFYSSNPQLVDFIYSALLIVADAAGKPIGKQGTRANILFFIEDNAIQSQKLNTKLFQELPKKDMEFLERIRFANDLCALEIPNSQLSILVLDPTKTGGEENAKICAIYALSLILGADLPRPDKNASWESILAGMLVKFASERVDK